MFAPQSIINGCTLEAIKESYRRRSSLPWAVSEMSYSLLARTCANTRTSTRRAAK